MIDLSNVKYAPVIEEITDVLCNKTQNVDKGFYRVEVAYFLAKMASSMRASIKTKDRGVVPVNVYALALASSGYGKGHSVNIMENEFIRGFKKKFLEETMPEVANQHLDYIAQETGFFDCSHFIRTYKKWRGITPKQERMKNKEVL